MIIGTSGTGCHTRLSARQPQKASSCPAPIIDTPLLTVIIVTKDRADDLNRMSLPSLARQTYRFFEVLVWDASGDDRTRAVAADTALRVPWIHLHYARAPRVGTSCQRNDALESCKSDFILYIDDDLELFPTAIAELIHVFEADKSGHIAGCQCLLVDTQRERRQGQTFRHVFWLLWDGFRGM